MKNLLLTPRRSLLLGLTYFFTSPHAPSGRSFSLQTLKKTAESFPGLLVIDEAYADFAAETALPLLNDFEMS